jgi:thymidylate synthase (FAD)
MYEKQSVELVAMTRPTISEVSPEEFVAYIARIAKVKDNPERLLRYLIKHAHWSPFEHTFVTFKIVTSRSIGRALIRHRSFTFQELSQRYEKINAFIDPELRGQAQTNRQSSTQEINPQVTVGGVTLSAQEAVRTHIEACAQLYEQLLEAGVARECARSVLPECTATIILMTGSMRSWIHFLAIRDDERAQKEIQEIARVIKQVLWHQFPTIATAAFTPQEQ